jgi:hypothetical protein
MADILSIEYSGPKIDEVRKFWRKLNIEEV